MANFLLTTTGTAPATLTIPEFGNRVLTSPLSNFDLSAEFNELEIKESVTLASFLDLGYITIDLDGQNITTGAGLATAFAEPAYKSKYFSTGLVSGGIISINGVDDTKFDIADGSGVIIDNWTTPSSPRYTEVTWTGLTAQSVTNLATQPVTYIAIDSDGTIVESSTPFTNEEKRIYIDLGVLVHTNNTNITVVNNQPVLSTDALAQTYDLINSLGFFNVNGGIEFTPNGANLSIDRSAGTIFKQGSNYENDPANPHVKTISSATAYSDIRYRLRTAGSEILPGTAFIDPNNYDNAGVLTSVPTGKVTVQRINIFSSGDVRLQYGQNLYDSIDDGIANAPSEEFVIEPNIDQNGLFRAFLIVKQGATDLSDTQQATFIQASTFGKANETYPGAPYRTSIINATSTGLRSGGELTVNTSGSPSTLDISAGNGVIVDNYTDPNNPTFTVVTWPDFTGITPTFLPTNDGTYILVQADGTLVQLPDTSPPTPVQRRDNVILGFVGHADNTNVIATFNFPISNVSPISQIEELAQAIGPFNVSGNEIILPGPGLTLTKAAGESYFFGGNFHVNSKIPSRITNALLTAPTLLYAKQDTILGPTSANVDTAQYDNAGTLTAMPVNQFTNHRIWIDPINNRLIFQYGQNVYGNLADAELAIPTETYVIPSGLTENSFVLGVLITQQGTTDLSDPADATFVPQSKFSGSSGGGGGGGGTGTLQDAYNNSGNPEILTDASRGALTLRRGSTADTDNLLEVQNGSAATTFSINGNGVITLGSYQGTAITDTYISSAATWNAKQDALTFGISDTNTVVIDSATVVSTDYAKFTANGLEGRSFAEVKTDLSLDNVENTALSTWPGSVNITTLGTITSGTWNGSVIGEIYGGTGKSSYVTGNLLYADSTTTLATIPIGSAGSFLRSDSSVPSWSTTTFPNSATAGDIIYASGLNNYDNLPAVAIGSALLSQGVGAAPAWSAITEDYLSGLGTGTAGQLLESDGAGGFAWTEPINPPDVSTYSAATVTLTNIANTYTYYAGFDTSANSIEVTLPAASAGKVTYTMKDIGCNSETNIIRFVAAGADTIITTITGDTSVDLSTNGGAIILTSDGTNTWWLS